MSLKQLKKMPFASDFVRAIEPLLERGLPDRFFDSFEYNETGNNLCHPRTLGLLAKAAWSLPAAAAVEIDVHLNVGAGVKFQPDLTVRDHRDRLFLIVDFESPNSSDARIVSKDVGNYLDWARAISAEPIEYLIITSRPDGAAPTWQARHYHREARREIQQNPFRYWVRHYRENLKPEWSKFPITFANLNGNRLNFVAMGLEEKEEVARESPE